MQKPQETWVGSLGNPKDRGAWWAIAHEVAKSRHDWVTSHTHTHTRTHTQSHTCKFLWRCVFLEEALGGLKFAVFQEQKKWCDLNAETEERRPIVCNSRAIVSKSNLILSWMGNHESIAATYQTKVHLHRAQYISKLIRWFTQHAHLILLRLSNSQIIIIRKLLETLLSPPPFAFFLSFYLVNSKITSPGGRSTDE